MGNEQREFNPEPLANMTLTELQKWHDELYGDIIKAEGFKAGAINIGLSEKALGDYLYTHDETIRKAYIKIEALVAEINRREQNKAA